MSFQQGVTGLNAAGMNLDVIGNNVANASTIGAKASRAEFADIYNKAGGGGNPIGGGVEVSAVVQQFNQGGIASTGNALDLAINGNGFFQLRDDKGMTVYSRNGQFQVDREGKIVNAQGLHLLGNPIDPVTGKDPGEPKPLQVPTVGVDPAATTRMDLEINVPSTAKAIDTVVHPIDFNDARTYNHTTSLVTYDAKGQDVVMTYFFQKTANDTWSVYAAANGAVINPDGAGKPQPIVDVTFKPDGSEPLSFNVSGTAITPAAAFKLTIPSTTVSTDTSSIVTEPMVDVEIDFTGLTQFGSPFGPTDLSQNGAPPGRLSGITVLDNGTVMASYSSGQSAPIGQLEIANFRNPQGLRPMGGNLWASTFGSGDPVKGAPGGGNLGSIQSSSLENSNIDLTSELVNMMVAQRIYQANAQTIKTQDQVMQTLVNLR